MTSETFIGNAKAVKTLADRADRGGGHAYLLTGPVGVGKRTLAERFAASLLCERENGPCGQCGACLLRISGNHPDYHVLPRDGALTIAQVRELSRSLELSPHGGRHQVGVIPGAERLAVPAQNALLKLLEEPPGPAVLILTAPTPTSLLPTTVSRCQRVPLGPVPVSELVQGLERRGRTDAEALAARAESRPGLALRLADDPAAAATLDEIDQTLFEALAADVPDRLALAKRLADDPEALPQRLDRWIGLYRGSLREAPDAGPARLAELTPLAKRIDGLVRLFAARRQLRYNPNTQLLLEQLLLNLGH